MLFWKIDEETIRCLINRQEIDNMGYDLDSLTADASQMEAFLEAIVQSSREFIEWHPENGIQNYMARALPADQFLITISCTFQDELIDRNLEQIRLMTEALQKKVSKERIEEIAAMSGDEKEQAFAELSKDLHAVCNGEIAEEKTDQTGHTGTMDQEAEPDSGSDSQARKADLPDRKLTFAYLDDLITFAGMLKNHMLYRSSLYRCKDQYELLVCFDRCEKDSDAVAFVLAAEEYGGICEPIRYDHGYLMEHGTGILFENALEVLSSF